MISQLTPLEGLSHGWLLPATLHTLGAMIKKLTVTLFAIGLSSAAILTTGCQTIQGAGQDIEKAGEALEEAVK